MSPMNNRRMTPTQEPGVLDFAPGAAAAYSLRNLSYTYAGPVVTVRRSTDDAEADFTAAEVSDGTLAAWCMGGDGFVKTWHDQSQNGRDASQTTTGYQPQIVDSGALVTQGGNAALQFDGTDDVLTVPSSTATFKFLHDGTKSALFFAASFGGSANPDDIYAVMGNNGGGTANVGIICAYDDRASASANDGLYVFVGKGVGGQTVVFLESDNTLTPQDQHAVTVLLDPSNPTTALRAVPYVDGASVFGINTGTQSPSTADATYNLQIGANGFNVGYLLGTISELIIYPTDQTALRTRIEGNLAWYY